MPFLRCPVCASALALESRVVRCARGHAFDVARQGYVTLRPPGSKAAGDDAGMLDAREHFLAAGHYGALRRVLAERAAAVDAPGCVADVGAGTGWYLAGVLDRCTGRVGVALDASAAALRRAAAAHPRAAGVGADVWAGLPLADGAAAVVMVVFSPRNAEEFARVLHPGGRLLVLSPTPDHLHEARELLGLLDVEQDKEARLEATLSDRFAREHVETLELPMSLTHDDALALAAMGPSARHTREEELRARVAAVPRPWRVTASVRLAVYRPA